MTRHILIPVLALILGLVVGRLSGESRDIVLHPSGSIETNEQMESAILDALETPVILDRVTKLSTLLQQLTAENVQGAETAFDQQISIVDNRDLRLFVSAWARLDPHAAMEGVLRWPLPSKRAFGAGIAAYEWAAAGGAIELRLFVAGLREREARGAATRGLVKGWARAGGGPGLTKLLGSVKAVETRDEFAELIVNEILADRGVEAVIEWSDSLDPIEDPDLKRICFRKALRQVANRDPVRGGQWYAEVAEQDFARRTMPIVAGEWVGHDPAAGYQWIAAQDSQGEARVRSLARWMARWSREDPVSALDWMSSQLETDFDEMFEEALPGFLGILVKDNPAEVADWIAFVEDDKQRKSLTMLLITSWRGVDPTASAAWVEANDIVDPTLKPLPPSRSDAASFRHGRDASNEVAVSTGEGISP